MRGSTLTVDIWNGVVAGTGATVAMSGVMVARQVAGKMGRMPPKLVTSAAIEAVGAKGVSDRALNALTVATHLGFGAAAGGTFGFVTHRAPRLRGIGGGLAFGTLVWLISYAGWIPALKIMPSPPKDRPGRPFSMLLAHWAYGSVLGVLMR